MQMSLGHFIGQFLEILRKLPVKNWNVEKLILARSRYVETANTCCMLHGMSQGVILIVFTVYVDTVNTGSNYIVYHSTKSLNYNLF